MTHAPALPFAEELQDLREVIHHARKVGARETLITIDLLEVLLAKHDETFASPAATLPLARDKQEQGH